MAKSSYIIHGMTCQNCVKHVQKIFAKMPGAHNVQVSLERKTADVDWRGEAPSIDLVKAGISDAGYELKE
jgi:copper chaperone CopZ